MKKLYFAVLVGLGIANMASAQDATFGGLEKAMDPGTYQRAGLQKLTTGERAVLDEFVKNYVTAKQKDAAAVAAAQAVDRAVNGLRSSYGGSILLFCRHVILDEFIQYSAFASCEFLKTSPLVRAGIHRLFQAAEGRVLCRGHIGDTQTDQNREIELFHRP